MFISNFVSVEIQQLLINLVEFYHESVENYYLLAKNAC